MIKVIISVITAPFALLTFFANVINAPKNWKTIIPFLPDWITHDWVRFILGLLSLGYIIWFSYKLFCYYKKEDILGNENKKLKNQFVNKKGIKFDFTSYLGAKKKEDDLIIVGCIQVRIQNTTNKNIVINKAYIVSNLNGKKIPIKIKTLNKGYVDFENLSQGIPPNQWFYTQALFYTIGDRPEGIVYDKFLREFSDFSYVINVGGEDVVIKTIKPHEVKILLRNHFPDPQPIASLMAKD